MKQTPFREQGGWDQNCRFWNLIMPLLLMNPLMHFIVIADFHRHISYKLWCLATAGSCKGLLFEALLY